MQGLQDLIPLLATLSLSGLIAAVGMDSSLGELFSLFRRPKELARAVLAVNVIVPVAATLLVPLFPLTPIARGAIILMAVSPVPPLVPGKQLKGGADKSYAYALYTALACLSVVIVPVTVAILSQIYGVSVSLGPLAVARNVALSVLLPLAVGLALRRVLGDRAGPLSDLLRKLSMMLLLPIVVLLVIRLWPGMIALVGNGTIAAMALVVAVGLAAGHMLGGPERADRVALAMAAGTRHPGIALMIAKAAGADKSAAAAIVGFLLVGIAVGVPYQIWLKRRPRAVTLGA
jgi:BASS family bile acid:Na+ symporter